MTNEITKTEGISPQELTLNEIKNQVILIQKVMKSVMKENEHYGKIPGCGNKPTLLKAGAEKLALTFRFAPSYKITKSGYPNRHREYEIITTLTNINNGKLFGEGIGSCSTMENKYKYRNKNLICPVCGKETIIKGKKEYGGGFICYGKKGGCGEKFSETDDKITNQEVGKIEHDNPADHYNTILKMAKKRSLVDAILTVTAASDIFTQDLEDLIENQVLPQSTQEEKPKEEKPTELSSYLKIKLDEYEECLKAEKAAPEELKDSYLKWVINEAEGKSSVEKGQLRLFYSKVNEIYTRKIEDLFDEESKTKKHEKK